MPRRQALDGCLVLLDGAWEQLDVDDRAVGLGDEVHDLTHREVLTVAQRQHGNGNDLVGLTCFVEKRPDVARLVLVGEVGREVDLVFGRAWDGPLPQSCWLR